MSKLQNHWKWIFLVMAALLIGACSGQLPDELSSFEGADAVSGSAKLASQVEFTGTVVEQEPVFWSIDDQTVVITGETEIKDPINVGELVKVHAFETEDGVFIAREIELANDDQLDDDDLDDDKDDLEDEKSTGMLESIENGIWTIGGAQFLVTENTELDDGLAVGVIVEVEFIVDDDGNFVAIEIETDSDDDMGEDDDDDYDDDDEYDDDDDEHDDDDDEHDDDDDEHDDDDDDDKEND